LLASKLQSNLLHLTLTTLMELIPTTVLLAAVVVVVVVVVVVRGGSMETDTTQAR
jgi:hypothetical protein